MNHNIANLFSRLVIGLGLALVISLSPASAERVKVQIIDGTKVPATDYPAVTLVLVRDFSCTGTLIAPRHVLTAAHCFFDDSNRRIKDASQMQAIVNNVPIGVSSITIHPTYVSRSAACIEGEIDAAIMTLEQSPSGVNPISISRSEPTVGTSLLLAGFGTQGTGATGEDETVPKDGYLNIGTTSVETISNSYVSWIFNHGEANTAVGDSGGPAFVDQGGVRYIHSITCGGTGNSSFSTESSNTRGDVIAAWADSITGSTPQDLPPTLLLPSSLTTGQNIPYGYDIQTTGSAPMTIAANGLPAGLTLDGARISGTPTESGSFNVTISATNGVGTASGTLLLNITPFDPSNALQLKRVVVDFRDNAYELLTIRGTLTLTPNFSPRRSRVRIQVAELEDRFTLNRKGFAQRKNGYDTVRLTGRMNRGLFAVTKVRFFVGLGDKEDLYDKLDQLFPYEAEELESSYRVNLPIEIEFNGVSFHSTIRMRAVAGGERWVSE